MALSNKPNHFVSVLGGGITGLIIGLQGHVSIGAIVLIGAAVGLSFGLVSRVFAPK